MLKFNTCMPNVVHFTIVVLTWYELTSYYILLPMSIPDSVCTLWAFIVGVLFMSPLKLSTQILA